MSSRVDERRTAVGPNEVPIVHGMGDIPRPVEGVERAGREVIAAHLKHRLQFAWNVVGGSSALVQTHRPDARDHSGCRSGKGVVGGERGVAMLSDLLCAQRRERDRRAPIRAGRGSIGTCRSPGAQVVGASARPRIVVGSPQEKQTRASTQRATTQLTRRIGAPHQPNTKYASGALSCPDPPGPTRLPPPGAGRSSVE